MNILGVMKILWIFYGVIAKLDYILGSFLFFFVFLKVKMYNEKTFSGCLQFRIFFGICQILLILFPCKQ